MLTHLLFVLSLAARPGPSQSEVPTSPTPAQLTLDAIVDRLPPIGLESCWDREKGERVTHPLVEEMRSRLAAGAKLSDEQWRRALLRSGAIRVRSRWPVQEPLRIAMAKPWWLDVAEIRAKSASPGIADAKGGTLHPSGCGNCAEWQRAADLRQSLGRLPVGRHRLVFDIEVEHGDPWWLEDGEEKLPMGVLWRGRMTFDVEVVESLDAAFPGRDGPELERGVRDAIGAFEQQWPYDGKPVDTLFVTVRPDTARFPELSTTALSLRVDLVHDGKSVTSSHVLVARDDDLASSDSFLRAALPLYGATRFPEFPVADLADPARLGRWKLRVSGTSARTTTDDLLNAEDRWSGRCEIALADAIARENERPRARERGPKPATSRPK